MFLGSELYDTVASFLAVFLDGLFVFQDLDGLYGLQVDVFPVDGFTVQNEQHGIRQGASDEYVSGLARHVDGRGFRLGLFAAQLKDDREGVGDLDGFALDIAGRPVRGRCVPEAQSGLEAAGQRGRRRRYRMCV